MTEARFPDVFVEEALAALERALGVRGNDLRNAQLATITREGRPALRTVVLRGFERGPEPIIETHSDARAGKVADIAGQADVALLAWSAAEQVQLRFTGRASLHRGDALARQRWEGLSEGARKPYGLAAQPGRALPDAGDGSHLPVADRFALFTVIRVRLASVDVLRLTADGGQMRAQASFAPDGLRADWTGA